MNPYAIIAALILWAASIGGVGYWQNHAGHTAERVAWQQKDNEELRKANASILALEESARDSEQKHAQEMSTIGNDFEKEKQDAKRKTDATLAALHAGTIVLRDPYTSSLHPAGSKTGQAVTTASGSDGGTTAKLSDESAGFLLNLSGEADEVVGQLTACQAVIRSDRGASVK